MPHPTLPGLLEMMGELIALPSVSCVNPRLDQGNLAVIEKLADWCQSLGFNTEILHIPDHSGKANLIATLGSGPGGLVLAGHTDTVPYDPGVWQHDPFKLTEQAGRLYGLGSSDMKSFFALALHVAAEWVDHPFKQPLILLATADEESGMVGAEALVKAGRPRAGQAIIGEPTSLRPVRAHKGIIMEAIRLIGRAGHSSDPELGNSALEGMSRVMNALLAWRDQMAQTQRNPLFKVPFPTLNLGHVHGGDNPNRICGECELHLDLRPLPGTDLESLRAELARRVGEAVQDSGLTIEIRRLFPGIAAMETEAGAAVVRAAEKLSGHPAEAAAFATEAPFLRELGMDTVVLGPGDIAQAHQPDEFLALERIPPYLDILRGLIQRFCLEEQGEKGESLA